MPRRARPRGLPAALAALVLALAACSSTAEPPTEQVGRGTAPAPAVPASPTAGAPPTASSTPFRAVRDLPRPAPPTRLLVPRIGVDAPVGALGLAADGTVEVPSEWGDVGWYEPGSRPGEPGPAVLLGHVDSRSGPAVFFRLHTLRQGDRVEVLDADGRRHAYAVTRLVRVPKTQFPTDEVYLPTLVPQLRLVTCGGTFDRRSGHYRDNVVAYADPVS